MNMSHEISSHRVFHDEEDVLARLKTREEIHEERMTGTRGRLQGDAFTEVLFIVCTKSPAISLICITYHL